MAYCTVGELRAYLGAQSTADDALLSALIDRAQAMIDRYTGRRFEASTDTVRYFDSLRDVRGRVLCFDKDICAITTITNGDGATIASTQYVTAPRNDTPYYAIQLLYSADVSWEGQADGDNENAIAVTGKWAYSATAPADVKQACIRWAAYLYRQKDAQVFDTTAMPAEGVIIAPAGVPVDVKAILEPYRKAV